MPPTTVPALLRRISPPPDRDPAADADLLRRAARDRDSAALGELVRRYGGLVWGVCRRTLRQDADADDAFQATFLALVRQAATLDPHRPLAPWLYTVAVRVARKAQARALRRAPVDVSPDRPTGGDVCAEVGGRELLGMVDAAIARLPARLRVPVVLCCVEGLTRDEAATAVGCSVTALKSRLERGRQRLRRLLEKRGVALPAAFLALGIGAARVSAELRGRAVAAALGQMSPAVATLAAVPLSWKLAVRCAALLLVGAVGVGVFGLPKSSPPKDPPTVKEAAAAPKAHVDRLGDPLPEAALLRLGTTRLRHPGSANSMALSPDGAIVLTLGWDGLYAWETATGKELWHAKADPPRHGNTSVGEKPLVFLPDGTRAVSVTDGPVARFWDLATGKSNDVRVAAGGELREIFGSVDVSKDGKTLALGGREGVVLCDLDGKVKARIANKPVGPRNPNVDRLLAWDDFSYPRFAPDGKSLSVVSSEAPTEVRLCNLDGAEQRRIALTKRYLDSAFSPDGTLLAVAERDDTVRVYDTESGKCRHEWPIAISRTRANENYLFRVIFSPDGKTLVAAASDRDLYLWDVKTAKQAGVLAGHAWYPRDLAFTKDGETLFSTGWDGEVRRWDMDARKQRPLPQGVRGSSVVAAAPDGKTLVYADGANVLRIVDAKTGEERRQVDVGFGPSQVAFTPDARTLAVGGSGGDKVHTCLIDLARGQVTRRWEWPKDRDPHASIEDLAFSPDGKRLAAMSFRQQSARIWVLTADRAPLVCQHMNGYGLSFSPDGRTLVTGGWDKKLRFWDAADGKLKKEFLLAPPKTVVPAPGVKVVPNDFTTDVRVYGVAWSPDGTRIAALDLGRRLWIWDAATMKERAVVDTDDIPRHNSLAFSPDGLWLATGGSSGRVRLWDAWTGEQVWDRGGHRADVSEVKFGPDSRTVLSGADDGLGYLWDLRPKALPDGKPADLWNALTGSNGPAAYGAFWAMLDRPDAALAAVTKYGKAYTETADASQVKKWIADLDSPKFAAREAAEKDLAARLRAVAPHLREALGKTPSPEQRARGQKLLDEWDKVTPGWSRVVSLLAHLGTPAAKEVLRKWADADPVGDVGRAAKKALAPASE